MLLTPKSDLKPRVLLTGANGFVGRVLAAKLVRSGFIVRAALRNEPSFPSGTDEATVVGNIDGKTDWSAALDGVDFVVHAAARAHVLHDPSGNEKLYISTNTDGTSHLAEAAAQSGIHRLVFLSSVKVNGEETHGKAYAASDSPNPQDGYGRSKWLAEQALAQISARTGLQTAIVRSPLVYGPGVRANFLRLLEWVDRGLPIPLAMIDNKRSFINVYNLCDLIVQTLQHPAAIGRCWMASDGHDLSTPDMIRHMAKAMAKHPRLLPVPISLLRFIFGLARRKAELMRLCGSLVVDISETRNQLGWSPPMTVEEALGHTVHWYCERRRLQEKIARRC